MWESFDKMNFVNFFIFHCNIFNKKLNLYLPDLGFTAVATDAGLKFTLNKKIISPQIVQVHSTKISLQDNSQSVQEENLSSHLETAVYM